jgi:glycosyltransferase involved in cell wall biosynthesis
VGRLGFENPVLWAYVPQAEVLLGTLDPGLVVYHCVDDIASQEGIDAASFRAAEERFARRADLVIASAPALADRMRRLSGNVLLAPNVADTESFSRALEAGPVDGALASLTEPRILFVGAVVGKKLDFDLLVGIARARRRWTLALIGPVGLGDPDTDVSALAAEPNIHLLGRRPHGELPAVMRAAAIGLIPYRRSRLTASIFPMKVYEYLAAGLPVIATGLPSLEGIADVALVEGVEAAVRAIEQALATDTDNRRRARSAAVRGHSWDARLAEIGAALS